MNPGQIGRQGSFLFYTEHLLCQFVGVIPYESLELLARLDFVDINCKSQVFFMKYFF